MLVLASTSASAAWEIVTYTTDRDEDNAIVLIDPAQITTEKNGILKTWVQHAYARPQHITPQTGRGKSANFVESRELALFDCAARKIAIKEFIAYTEKEKVVHTERHKTTAFYDVEPKSTGEEILEFVCEHNKNANK
jgi:hypothetical protein